MNAVKIKAKLNAKTGKYVVGNNSNFTDEITVSNGVIVEDITLDDMAPALKKRVEEIIEKTLNSGTTTEGTETASEGTKKDSEGKESGKGKKSDNKPKKAKAKKSDDLKAYAKVNLEPSVLDKLDTIEIETVRIKQSTETRNAVSNELIEVFKDLMQNVEAFNGFELNSKTRAKVVATTMNKCVNESYTKSVIAAIRYHYENGHKIPNAFLNVTNIRIIRYAVQNNIISSTKAKKPDEDYGSFIKQTKIKVAKHKAEKMQKENKQ